ncbi:hypothetical protein B9Z55_000023 [Caenorhabditis nigoni]|uniref:Uncharacterized protein n=1 Tax=Caenorhabditis nigoni TaxID=1611254 RepID=A0A2G5VK99_9PELO|nr:hypothetical protein B9Z55_000023 [Caenorhabditis nigoni]
MYLYSRKYETLEEWDKPMCKKDIFQIRLGKDTTDEENIFRFFFKFRINCCFKFCITIVKICTICHCQSSSNLIHLHSQQLIIFDR